MVATTSCAVRLCLILFASAAPLLGSEQIVRVEIQRATATPYHPEYPDMAGFKLKFDLRLTNRSEKPLNAPEVAARGDQTTRIAVLGVQWRQSDGSWTNLVQSTWVDDGRIQYQPCRSVASGGTVEIDDIASGLLLFKTQVVKLGQDPILRFNVTMFCRQSDGTVVSQNATTDALSIHLPTQR